MPEERKLATVLFADIAGSTAAGAAHDPEIVRRTLSRAFAEMRQVLEAHGGTVEKFIGDAVMCVFGVPAAHDDDADRAVRAAFALRERVGQLNASGRIPLELRIGVNSGQVVAGVGAETLVTGGPVNEAARLQQAASAGEILVGTLTHRLTTGGVRYGEGRRVAAKGVGEIAAYPAAAITSAVPEQHRGVAGLHAPLVGRDDELRLLVDAFRKTAGEKRAALVTVFGSAGVGKSRLVREFVDAIGSTAVRRGRCLPYGQGITFWPVVEVLRADAHITATDTLEQARSSLRAAALAAFAEATSEADGVARRLSVLAEIAPPEEALPEVTGDQLQHELRLAFRRYLERRAQREPIVLVFDDIHWAEPPLLDLIEHIAEWSRAPLFVVCLARPELRDRRKGWGGGLMNASAIALEPLTPEESRRLVADLLDIDDLPEALRAEVVSRAEGNPLYLEEFLRMLLDAGHITRRASRWVAGAHVADLVVPPTLQGLIAARLDQAPPNVKRTLQRAAVVGKVFWTNAAAALADDGSADERFSKPPAATSSSSSMSVGSAAGPRSSSGTSSSVTSHTTRYRRRRARDCTTSSPVGSSARPVSAGRNTATSSRTTPSRPSDTRTRSASRPGPSSVGARSAYSLAQAAARGTARTCAGCAASTTAPARSASAFRWIPGSRPRPSSIARWGI